MYMLLQNDSLETLFILSYLHLHDCRCLVYTHTEYNNDVERRVRLWPLTAFALSILCCQALASSNL